MNEKNRSVIYYLILFAGAFLCGYVIAAVGVHPKNSEADGPAGTEPNSAVGINRTITDEQRATEERNRRNVESLERIRSLASETDSALVKLRELNRGSVTIYQEIRDELNILQNFYDSVRSVYCNPVDSVDSKVEN